MFSSLEVGCLCLFISKHQYFNSQHNRKSTLSLAKSTIKQKLNSMASFQHLLFNLSILALCHFQVQQCHAAPSDIFDDTPTGGFLEPDPLVCNGTASFGDLNLYDICNTPRNQGELTVGGDEMPTAAQDCRNSKYYLCAQDDIVLCWDLNTAIYHSAYDGFCIDEI